MQIVTTKSLQFTDCVDDGVFKIEFKEDAIHLSKKDWDDTWDHVFVIPQEDISKLIEGICSLLPAPVAKPKTTTRRRK